MSLSSSKTYIPNSQINFVANEFQGSNRAVVEIAICTAPTCAVLWRC